MNHYQRLVKSIADLQRQMANVMRYGVIEEIKGDKVRVNLGKNHLGDDVISPWLNNGDLRGGSRVRRFYKKGQNVMVFSPNGDMRQAMFTPFAPNKNFLHPDHTKSDQDEETYQLEDLRIRQTKEGYTIWLLKPDQEKPSGHVKKLPEPKDDSDKPPEMMIKLNKQGGITARIGKMCMAVHEMGAKIKANKDWVVVVDGKVILSREPVYEQDPLPDDEVTG